MAKACASLLIFLGLCLTAAAGPQVTYVDQNAPGPGHDGASWDTAFLTIQEGVDGATPGGEVWVADGVYVENVVMGEGVAIYGGFLGAEPGGYEGSLDQRDFVNNVTTIDGNQSGSCVTMAFDTRVDGFTITNGSGTPHGENNAPHGGGVYCNGIGESGVIANNRIVENSTRYGGGILVFESSPTIQNSTIGDNRARYGVGGGVLCQESAPTIENCTISSNRATEGRGGGIYCEGGALTITNSTLAANSSSDGGGAIYCREASLAVTESAIVDNLASYRRAGGLYCGTGSRVVITDSVIAGNRSWQNGGGICLGSCQATIIGNTICGNSGTQSGAPAGGGVFCAYSALYIEANVIRENNGSSGGGLYIQSCTGTVKGNTLSGNTASGGGGVMLFSDPSPTVVNNTITGNSASGIYGHGGGVYCFYTDPCGLTNNTVAWNSADRYGGGIYSGFSDPRIGNNIVVGNTASEAGGGIHREGGSPQLRFNDFWANSPDDYYGCEPGGGDISADPLFVDPESGDFHLSIESPCIGAGYNGAPGMPDTDWEGEDRIVNGVVDIGADEYLTWIASAPDPQPECDGPLFGEPQAGFPGWVWFSIPLTPDCVAGSGCADPQALLGLDCGGKLWYWDEYGKFPQVYQPPVTWDLEVGDSYLLHLDTPVQNPSYEGLSPFAPFTFEHKLGRQGWTWIGMPGLTELAGDDFMSSVKVMYPSNDTGECRTAAQDYGSIPDNWITWGWPFWNTWRQGAETFTPYAPFGHNTCYPWVGYRVWVNIGSAASEDDPDQVTLLWPRAGG